MDQLLFDGILSCFLHCLCINTAPEYAQMTLKLHTMLVVKQVSASNAVCICTFAIHINTFSHLYNACFGMQLRTHCQLTSSSLPCTLGSLQGLIRISPTLAEAGPSLPM